MGAPLVCSSMWNQLIAVLSGGGLALITTLVTQRSARNVAGRNFQKETLEALQDGFKDMEPKWDAAREKSTITAEYREAELNLLMHCSRVWDDDLKQKTSKLLGERRKRLTDGGPIGTPTFYRADLDGARAIIWDAGKQASTLEEKGARRALTRTRRRWLRSPWSRR